MILKRKTPEERFAEDLARALEEEHKRWLESLPPEKRRLVLEREKLMLKNSPAWREAEKRIERGEIKLYWRKGENIYIDARDTMKNFPFKRHGDYLLLPSGLDDYMHAYPPIDLDWILAHAEEWRPRALASVKWLEEPVTDTGYDGYYEATYRCVVEARDGRRFLASVLECILLEECDGKKNAREAVARAASRNIEFARPRIEEGLKRGELSKEEAKKLLNEMPENALIGLAILRALGLVV